jgi:LCP family protein required for cell wall assembly
MWKRFLIGGVAIVLLSAGATATVALNKVTTIANEVFPETNRIQAPQGVIAGTSYDGAPETFLLIGSDKRVGSHDRFDRENPPHSDTLLLVRLDPEQGQTSVLSIPRDLLTHIVTKSGQVYYPEKINAAYTIGSEQSGSNAGGALLAAETVEHLLGIKLNGVIDVSFRGFIGVVDSLGCVYINVDHRYYNPEGTGYSAINLQPGYQKLCYENALSYVRYRHDDSDFVRVARQQDFIRALREQVSTSDLINEIDTVSKAVGRAISSTIKPSASELIKLAKLVVFSQEKPLRQVKFRFATDNTVIGGVDYVTSTPQLVHETVEDFLHGDQHVAGVGGPGQIASTAPPPHHGHSHTASFTPAAIGLYPTSQSARQEAFSAAVQTPFPVIYPDLQTGPATPQGTRAYTLEDPQHHRHHAFVEVFQQNIQGGYYDVEGMDWTNPPLIAHPNQEVSLGGRHYLFIDDGSAIHVIAWHEGGVLYWVSNTLREDLSNPQMINIAQSAHPLH